MNIQSSAAPPLFMEGLQLGENSIMQFLLEEWNTVFKVFGEG
jgi:hypothetical protein